MTMEELIIRITEQGASETAGSIRNINVVINQFNSSLNSIARIAIGQTLQNIGQSITGVGRSIKSVLTDNIIAMGVESIKTSMNFEQAMTKVRALSGVSIKEMGLLTEKAKEMGLETKYSATDAAEAFQYMAMAGWKTEDMLDGIKGVMDLAAASGEDLSLVADIVTDSLTAFGLTAKDTGRYVDLLTSVANGTNTSIAMLGESFKYAAPVMGAAGYTAEDCALALGIMANSGIKASQAGTTLRGAITNLMKPTSDAAGLMEEMGIKVSDSSGKLKPFKELLVDMREKFSGLTEEQKIQAAATLFGKTSMSGMLAILNSTGEKFAEVTKLTEDFNGAAEETARIMQDNLTGQLEYIKSTLEGIALKIGDLLLPYMKKLAEVARSLSEALFSLSPTGQKVVLVILALLAAIGPVVMIIGTFITWVGLLIMACAAIGPVISTIGAPAIIVIGLLAGFAAVVMSVYAGIIALLLKLGILQGAFDYLRAIVQVVVNIFKGDFVDAFNILTQKFGLSGTEADNVILKITSFKDQVMKLIDKVKDLALTLIHDFAKALMAAAKFIYDHREEIIKLIATLLEFGATIVKTIGNAITFFKNLYNGVKDAVKMFIELGKEASIAVGKIADIMSEIASDALNWGKNIIKSLIKGISSMLGNVKTAAKEVASAIKSYIGWESPTKLGPGKYSDEWAPNLMKMIEKGLKVNIPRIENLALEIASTLDLTSIKPNVGNAVTPLQSQQIQTKANEEFNFNGNIIIDPKQIRDLEDLISLFKNIKSESIARGGI